LNNSNLKKLLTEYDKKRLNNIYEAERRKEEIYSKNPRLQEIDDILSKEAIRVSKLLITSKDVSLLDELNKKISDLKKEKEKILNSINLNSDYLKPIYECKDCNDTGYIINNSNTTMCHCLKQKLFDIEYNKSNIYNLEKQNFNNFSLDLYSDEIDEKKYNSKISPRENIEKIKKLCEKFIENFDSENEKNLLFTGKTGLGKSFLSSCIANEILKKGKTVLYQTAPVMLDTIIDYRFGKDNSSKDIYDNLLTVDLLIIDDLGTECMNTMKFSELFNIINTRLLNSNNKVTKTIISTNLSLQNLFSTYDERIVSRIVGNYNICYFFGDDIRFKKR
jgi:DNA replication protein DnaC